MANIQVVRETISKRLLTGVRAPAIHQVESARGRPPHARLRDRALRAEVGDARWCSRDSGAGGRFVRADDGGLTDSRPGACLNLRNDRPLTVRQRGGDAAGTPGDLARGSGSSDARVRCP